MQIRYNWEQHGRALAESLVVPPNYSKISYELLPDLLEINDPQLKRPLTHTIIRATQTTSYGRSPYPCLDEFILSTLATRNGVQGSIRAWAINPGRNIDTSTGIITYHMKDNRWCEYIGRAHKGNNIMWHISLKDMTYWQTCHDPDCRTAGFRGQSKSLPDNVQEQLKEDLLAKAIECDLEFEKALMTLSISTVKPIKNEGETRRSSESVSLSLPTEPASLPLSSTNVKCSDGMQQAKCPVDEAYILNASFEEALIDFINAHPTI